MAVVVYVLCMLTSALCALLLLREHRRSGMPLLFWSGLSFVCWAINNLLVFSDLVLFPSVELALFRTLAAFAAVAFLLYGLVWDAA
jgi:hypothetical protein